MNSEYKNFAKNKRFPFFASTIVILFFVAVFLGFRNIQLKQDIKNIQTSSYSYDFDYLKEKAKRINPKANVVHNQDEELWKGNKKPIILKELTIGDIEGDDPNKIFYRIVSVKPDISGNIYVSEFNSGAIKKFDAQGNFLISIGKAGGGPGEFRGFLYYILDGDSILTVYDTGNQRMNRFTTNGNFLNSFQMSLEYYPKSFVRDNDGNIYFSYYASKQNKTIHKYDHLGNYIHSFCEPLAIKLTNPHILRTLQRNNYPGSLFYEDNKLFFSQSNPYYIAIYSPYGELIKQITRVNNFMRPPVYKIKGKESISVPRWVSSSLFSKVHTYLINVIYFPESYSEEQKTIVDIFDLEGNLLTSEEIDERIYPYAIDSKGNFYGQVRTQEGFEQVVRYSINF